MTGASGYLGCHIVYQLLCDGYRVRGSVRDLTDTDKTKQLRDLLPYPKFELRLVQADLLESSSWQKQVNHYNSNDSNMNVKILHCGERNLRSLVTVQVASSSHSSSSSSS